MENSLEQMINSYMPALHQLVQAARENGVCQASEIKTVLLAGRVKKETKI